jgi:hypothetical protein
MPARDDTASVLDASVTAAVEDGDVELSFAVRNAGDEPVECSFRDGQRVEAVAEHDSDGGDEAEADADADAGDDDGARDDDGAGEVWRYGDDRLLEEDIIELWGVAEELLSYETVQGNTRTIPRLTLTDYNLRE